MTVRLLILFSLFATRALADEPARELARRGRQAIDGGDYDEAIEAYEKAAEKLSDVHELDYNRAVAHYRKGDFDKASECFTRALATTDLDLEAKAKFNLGNCAYANALAKQENVSEAVSHLQTAIAHYRDAIEANPQDMDARANIEMAQLFMRQLLDKQKNEQQEQQEKNQQQEPEQQQQDNEQQQSDQEQKREQDQNQEQPAEQQQQAGEDEQKQQQPQPAENKKQQQQGEAAPQPAGSARQEQTPMTREQAERLLQLIRDKNLQRRQETQEARLRYVPVEKDW